MGSAFSFCSEFHSRRHATTEQELLVIRNHPNRVRRRSSVAPNAPRIRENKILEDLCEMSGIEPDVPPDRMRSPDLANLVRRLSRFNSTASTVQGKRLSTVDKTERNGSSQNELQKPQ